MYLILLCSSCCFLVGYDLTPNLRYLYKQLISGIKSSYCDNRLLEIKDGTSNEMFLFEKWGKQERAVLKKSNGC